MELLQLHQHTPKTPPAHSNNFQIPCGTPTTNNQINPYFLTAMRGAGAPSPVPSPKLSPVPSPHLSPVPSPHLSPVPSPSQSPLAVPYGDPFRSSPTLPPSSALYTPASRIPPLNINLPSLTVPSVYPSLLTTPTNYLEAPGGFTPPNAPPSYFPFEQPTTPRHRTNTISRNNTSNSGFNLNNSGGFTSNSAGILPQISPRKTIVTVPSLTSLTECASNDSLSSSQKNEIMHIPYSFSEVDIEKHVAPASFFSARVSFTVLKNIISILL